MIVDRALAETIAREAFSEPYRQIKPFTTYKLERCLKDRGGGLRWETIHHLWALGVLHPIAVDEPALNGTPGLGPPDRFVEIDLDPAGRSFIDLGCEVTEDLTFAPPDKLSSDVRNAVWWHPFQLWQFDAVHRVLDLRVTGDAVLQGPDDVARLVRRIASWVLGDLARLAQEELHHSFLEVLALLLAADPLVHTSVYGSYSYDPAHGEPADGYLPWIAQQAGASLLGRHSLTGEEVQRWHERLNLAGHALDPFGPFRVAVRQADRRQRGRLQGRALFAQDLYDTAQILRHYLGRYYGVALPLETEVGMTGPGSERPGLRELVRTLGLDPQERVRWFVEGETEEAYVHAWAERAIGDIRLGGIDLRNVKGTGNFSPSWLRPDLKYCQREKIFAYVSVDEDIGPVPDKAHAKEPEHLRLLRKYEREQLLPVGFACWKDDFVSANFTPTEIAAIATRLAQGGGATVTITPEDIERARAFTPDGTKRDYRLKLEAAVGSALWAKAKISWNKGEAWGRALAEWAIEHPLLADGKTEQFVLNDDERPITKIITLLLGARSADYDVSVEHHAARDNKDDPCCGLQAADA
jgi:hypothetical protein